MKKTIFALICLCLLFVGCATTPISPTSANQVPTERVLSFQQKTPLSTATLVVTRDEGFLGSGCYYAVFINGTLAARLDVGETCRFFLQPGEILLRAARDPLGKGPCALGQDQWTQRETILRENEIKYFRLLLDVNGKTDIQRADQ